LSNRATRLTFLILLKLTKR